MCMTYKQSCSLSYKKLKPKIINIFWYIQNYDSLSKQNEKLGKFCTI